MVLRGLGDWPALAHSLVGRGTATPEGHDAIVAALRRHDFGAPEAPVRDLFRRARFRFKNRILVPDLPKDESLVRELQDELARTDHDRAATLNFGVGTTAVKLFVDRS